MIHTTLPVDSTARKEYSISRGCMAYFPAAIAGIAHHSFIAGAKHTNGELIHKRWLSSDHEDCIERHLMDLRDMLASLQRSSGAGLDEAVRSISLILSEANALAWRACALSQQLHEDLGNAPLAPAARLYEEPRADEHEQETFHPLGDEPPVTVPITPPMPQPEAWVYPGRDRLAVAD